jgi:hypothetical protein
MYEGATTSSGTRRSERRVLAAYREHVPNALTTPGFELVEGGITEAELTALALAADPDQRPDVDARPDPAVVRQGPLPLFYMPPAMPGRRPHGRAVSLVALVVVTALLVITALGFCVTYGQLSFA